jgi:glucose-1-phosphate adenylyltransferase
MKITQILRETLTLILAGGQGERLYPLTRDRAKPAVPFAGHYRIIDFTLSNCINSGLKRIYVLTQYKSQSLDNHLRLGWNIFANAFDEYFVLSRSKQPANDCGVVIRRLYFISQLQTAQIMARDGKLLSLR